MKALDSLILTLSKHFPMHPSRQKTFAGMILGAMSSNDCQHHSLTRYVSSPTQQAALRKVERFFQQQELTDEQCAQALVDSLQFKGKFDLCLDRSNWQFGAKNVNYLVLSWRISKEICLPLLFVDLDKAGNSNTQERLNLLGRFDKLFGCSRIKRLFADREFIGVKWMCYLASQNIPFYIRIRENTLLSFGQDLCHARDFFQHLTDKTKRLLVKDLYGYTFYFAGTKSVTGELVIVMTNQDQTAEHILNCYSKRWAIEMMFRKLKTSGFNWENTHMKLKQRLVKLLVILTLSSLYACLFGLGEKIPWKKTLKCFVKSIFRKGLQVFQHLLAKGAEGALTALLNLLEAAPQLLSIESDG